jgi:SAM-dependent methyltransferase
MAPYRYQGNELDLFRNAHAWKTYYGSFLSPYCKGRVLEVGAGIGATTEALLHNGHTAWVCLEPDPAMAAAIDARIRRNELAPHCTVVTGTIRSIPRRTLFNAILYVDVIEHIFDDTAEISSAIDLLSPGGALMVLAPAHQWLYSEFDKAIGHYKRYNKKNLSALINGTMVQKKLIFLDSMGLIASAVNRFFMKKSCPDKRQIKAWDTVLVPLSRITDILSFHCIGKSILGIWQKKPDCL